MSLSCTKKIQLGLDRFGSGELKMKAKSMKTKKVRPWTKLYDKQGNVITTTSPITYLKLISFDNAAAF